MIHNGQTRTPTGGTAVPLAASAPYHYGSIVVTALEDNAGTIVVGGPTGLVANLAGRTGTPLDPGDSYIVEPGERGQGLSREGTGTVFINSETGNDGDGVSWGVQE